MLRIPRTDPLFWILDYSGFHLIVAPTRYLQADFPEYSETVQELGNLVFGLIRLDRFSERRGFGHRLLLESETGMQIVACRRDGFKLKPQGNCRLIDTVLRRRHGAGVPKRMWAHPFFGERRTFHACNSQVLGRMIAETVVRQWPASLLREDGFVWTSASLFDPYAQGGHGIPPQRNSAILATLALPLEMGPCLVVKVFARRSDRFRGPQACLQADKQQSVVASSYPHV